MNQRKISPVVRDAARRLRRESTTAEEHLWQYLRDRRLDGRKFRRQHVDGSFVLDFYCHSHRIGIELDGGVHARKQQRQRDLERSEALESEGIHVIRFRNHDVLHETDPVLTDIRRALMPSSDVQ